MSWYIKQTLTKFSLINSSWRLISFVTNLYLVFLICLILIPIKFFLIQFSKLNMLLLEAKLCLSGKGNARAYLETSKEIWRHTQPWSAHGHSIEVNLMRRWVLFFSYYCVIGFLSLSFWKVVIGSLDLELAWGFRVWGRGSGWQGEQINEGRERGWKRNSSGRHVLVHWRCTGHF